jgi:hypothetical protein
MPTHFIIYAILASTSTAFAPSQTAVLTHVPLMMSQSAEPFNEAAYESDRLSKDAEAMDAMKRQAEGEYSKLRTPWKWRIRKAVWDYLEKEDIAMYPRRV